MSKAVTRKNSLITKIEHLDKIFQMSKEKSVPSSGTNVPNSEFPLLKAAGLSVWAPAFAPRAPYVLCEDVERWLAEAPVVYGSPEAVKNTPLAEVWYPGDSRGHTHAARLVCIEPIVRDTAESLLREIVLDHERLCRLDGRESKWPLYQRARKLLERK